jgi:DNA-binding LytR/AlgR family response regulator
VPLTIHVITNYFYYRRGLHTVEIQYNTVYWIVRLLLAPLPFLYARKFWMEISRLGSLIPIQIAGFLGYLICHWGISMFIINFFIDSPDKRVWNLFNTTKNESFIINLLLYSVTVLIYYLWTYSERSAESRRQGMLLEKSLTESMDQAQKINEQLQSSAVRKNPEVLSIKTGQKTSLINYHQIICFLADGPYIKVVTESNAQLMSMSMRELEKMIPDSFQRVHRSSIVNINYVTQVKSLLNGDYTILLKNGMEIRLSRTYREKLRAALGKF